jgi:hypothetical protein
LHEAILQETFKLNKYIKLWILLPALLLSGCLSTTNQNDVAIASIKAQQAAYQAPVHAPINAAPVDGTDRWIFLLIIVAVLGFAAYSMWLQSDRMPLERTASAPSKDDGLIDIPLQLLPDSAKLWLIENHVDMSAHRMSFDTTTGFYILSTTQGKVLASSSLPANAYLLQER